MPLPERPPGCVDHIVNGACSAEIAAQVSTGLKMVIKLNAAKAPDLIRMARPAQPLLTTLKGRFAVREFAQLQNRAAPDRERYGG